MTAKERIIADLTEERIISFFSLQDIISFSPFKGIVSRPPFDNISVASTDEGIIPGKSPDIFTETSTNNQVISIGTGDDVIDNGDTKRILGCSSNIIGQEK
ncbi:hypothetical protein L2E81_14960 [Planktothrix agardhii 1033]|nr:hypothetical protein [Planktothrix agardhii 1033]